MKLYEKLRITLLQIPPKSPDLNPIEKMWGWVRKQLRTRDLKDLAEKRPVLGKTAYRERIKRLLKGPKAQAVAKRFYTNLRTMAFKVNKAKGRSVHG